jgi:hypothetical protein
MQYKEEKEVEVLFTYIVSADVQEWYVLCTRGTACTALMVLHECTGLVHPVLQTEAYCTLHDPWVRSGLEQTGVWDLQRTVACALSQVVHGIIICVTHTRLACVVFFCSPRSGSPRGED